MQRISKVLVEAESKGKNSQVWVCGKSILVKDVMHKCLFPKTMVFFTEQQFLWEDLSFGETFYIADIFQQNKMQKILIDENLNNFFFLLASSFEKTMKFLGPS